MAELRVIQGGAEDWSEDERAPESTTSPNDEPAERTIVCSAFYDSGLRAQARALLRPEHFYHRRARTLFETMAELDELGVEVDSTTLLTRLRETGRLGEFEPEGVAGYFARIAPSGNVKSHARAIRDAWRMRRLLTECMRWSAEAGCSRGLDLRAPYGPAQALLERVAQTASDLATDSVTFGAQSSQQVAGEAIRYLAQFDDPMSQARAVPTGFGALTRKTTGLHAPDLILLGALPSMGKTALLAGIAVNAAEAGVGVAFFSLEMTSRDIMLRLAGARAGVSMAQMRNGTLRKDGAKLVEALAKLQMLPIIWDGLRANDPAATIPDAQELLLKAGRLQSSSRAKGRVPLGLVVVDYLQRIKAPAGTKTREESVATNAKALKLMATRLGIPVLCAAALNRASSADGRKPEMRDLRESGAAEYEADCIWLLHRDDYKHERRSGNHVLNREAEVIIAKSRNGDTGSVFLGFDREYTRFRELSDDQAPIDWHEAHER